MTPPPKGRRLLTDVFANRRLALMLALGFSSGLPFLLVFSTLSIWLRRVGISRTEIGLLSYVALAYTFKFAWAPIVDSWDVPWLARVLGRRRAWMLVAQVGVAMGLVGLAASDPSRSLSLTVACALAVAFWSATQDVVVDAWRIDAAPISEQGTMAATYQLGYRLALLCSGAGALYIAEYIDWTAAYLAMAVAMTVGIGATLVASPADQSPDAAAAARQREPFSLQRAVIDPLLDLFKRKGPVAILILALVAIYRLPDFVAGVMANPLYVDLGFSNVDIANVTKIYGVWIGILGAFAGGFSVVRIGLMPSVLIGGIAAAASNLMFAWLAVTGRDLNLLVASISLDNFASGFAGTALIAYMSGLTSPAFAATQYALLSSLYALPGKFVGGTSGLMVEAFGYPAFFTLTAMVGVPVVLLTLFVWRHAPGRDPADATAPAAAAAPS